MGGILDSLYLMAGNPAHGMELEKDDLQGSFQQKPFCDSIILIPAEKIDNERMKMEETGLKPFLLPGKETFS